MEWYIKVLKQYADFSGRARRKEYWNFVLVHSLVILGLFVFALILDMIITPAYSQSVQDISAVATGRFTFSPFGALLIMLYLSGTIIPALAVAVRRLHDIDKSGWWIFTGLAPATIYNIMLYGVKTNNVALLLLTGFISTAGGIWLIVLLCIEGRPGDNRYGQDPKKLDLKENLKTADMSNDFLNKKSAATSTVQFKPAKTAQGFTLANLEKVRYNTSANDILAMFGQPSTETSAQEIFTPLLGRVPASEEGKSYWSYTTPYGDFQVAVKDNSHVVDMRGLELIIEKIKATIPQVKTNDVNMEKLPNENLRFDIASFKPVVSVPGFTKEEAFQILEKYLANDQPQKMTKNETELLKPLFMNLLMHFKYRAYLFSQTGRSFGGICDSCSSDINIGNFYLMGSYGKCSDCTLKSIVSTLDWNYYLNHIVQAIGQVPDSIILQAYDIKDEITKRRNEK
ncbi:MAG: DUF805 domain-containing protein [Prevotellaceae bacterium]|jgi:uncharacterized membrane protein YhaH (DUF805 family)|nr:DUF805 domain-containing protein [Prevotellaceae bacterium]